MAQIHVYVTGSTVLESILNYISCTCACFWGIFIISIFSITFYCYYYFYYYHNVVTEVINKGEKDSQG